MSSSGHPRRSSSAVSAGYFDTSSSPAGTALNAVEVAADADVIRTCDLSYVIHVIGHVCERRFSGSRQKSGHECDHDDPAVGSQQPQHIIGDVAAMVVESARIGVRKDDGRFAHSNRVEHCLGGRVAQIDQHAEPIHLAHDLLAEFR